MLGWCCKNFGVIVNEVLADSSTKELEVTVTIIAFRGGTSRSTKQPDGGKNGVRREIL